MLILCQKLIQLGVPASHRAGQAHDHHHPWSVILMCGRLVAPGCIGGISDISESARSVIRAQQTYLNAGYAVSGSLP